MVKSGLVLDPRVSHYRLAAHLLLALAVIGCTELILLNLLQPTDERPSPQACPRGVRIGVLCITAGILIQVASGAFTAGLKAGYGFNTFPLRRGFVAICRIDQVDRPQPCGIPTPSLTVDDVRRFTDAPLHVARDVQEMV